MTAYATDPRRAYDCIRGIAEYEQLAHEVEATEQSVRESFFGARPAAEALIAERDGAIAEFQQELDALLNIVEVLQEG